MCSNLICALTVFFVEVIEAKLEARRLTDETIHGAVKMWCDPATRQAVVDKYGEIGDWDVSRVTSMSQLFSGQKDFNENISRWDTSNVTNMGYMFAHASSFNQPVEGWNTAKVTNMSRMFESASSFSQPVEGWNTANVINMSNMFYHASRLSRSFTQRPSWLKQ